MKQLQYWIRARHLLAQAGFWIGLSMAVMLATVPASSMAKDWFGKTPAPTPDATVRITFPWRESLGFDPAQLPIAAEYEAANPQERGVRKEKRKTRNCPVEIPVPFGCNTHTWEEPVKRSLPIAPGWRASTAPNILEIRLPERLPGPGDYRLRHLALTCPEALCHGKLGEDKWTLQFTDAPVPATVPPPAAAPGPATLRLGVDAASSYTAQYQGNLLALPPSTGSYIGREDTRKLDARSQPRALQDAQGRWHMSPTAYAEPYEDPCGEPFFSSSPRIDAAADPGLTWARGFSTLAMGQIYDFTGLRASEANPRSTIANWTGCAALQAEGLGARNEDSEVRRYYFTNGRLWMRRIDRMTGDGVHYERYEYDSADRLLFHDVRDYKERTRKETEGHWSRLAQEAYPQEAGPAPRVDTGALARELETVRKLVGARLADRPQ